jgi:hypothetical protein
MYEGILFDCTNTVLKIQGDTCDGSVAQSFVATFEESAFASFLDSNPMETPATSSGSSHAAKETIAVTAAATAWMASFGT